MKKLGWKPLIFALIGVFNTVFDIAVYVGLRQLGWSALAANIVSVSLALVGSYLLNSKLTFRAKRWTARSFIGFVVVTLFGLWVLQTAAIYLIASWMKAIPSAFWASFGPAGHSLQLAAPKIAASGVSLVWNYVWYNKVIFKQHRLQDLEYAADETLPLA